MQYVDFITINNLDYHKDHQAYNARLCFNAIKEKFPDDENPDLNDPKYAEIVKEVAFLPYIGGTIARRMGIHDKIMTMEMLDDFQNGWVTAKYLPQASPLQDKVVDTPRGPMVMLNRNAAKMDDKGNYLPPQEDEKGRRAGIEMLLGMGKRTSMAIALLATEDPSFERRLNQIAAEAFTESVVPKIESYAQLKKGENGIYRELAQGCLVVAFTHPENRGADILDKKPIPKAVEGEEHLVRKPYLEVEPHYHFHFDLLNTTLGYDDEFYSLTNDLIIQNKDEVNFAWMGAIKTKMEKEFGFVFDPIYLDEDNDEEKELAPEEKNITSYDLPESWFSDEQVLPFSQRKKGIEDHLKETGKHGHDGLEYARLETRKNKGELTPSEMKQQWKAMFDYMGITPEHIKSKLDFNQKKPTQQLINGRQLAANFVRKHFNQEMKRQRARQKNTKSLVAEEISLAMNDGSYTKGTGTATPAWKPEPAISEAIANLRAKVSGDKNTTGTPKESVLTYKKLATSDEALKQFAATVDGAPSDETLTRNFLRKHKEIYFTAEQFKSHMAKQLLNTMTPAMAWQQAERIYKAQCVPMLDKEKLPYYQDFLDGKITNPEQNFQMQMRYMRDVRFTTKDILRMEKEIVQNLKARDGETHWKIDRETAKKYIAQWTKDHPDSNGKVWPFMKGQEAALESILCDDGAVVNVSGRAGAGKSTLLKAAKDNYEARNYIVLGTAISGAATNELAKSTGMKAGTYMNVAKLNSMIGRGRLELTNKHVLFVDEGGLLDLESFHKLMTHVNKAGAKMVLSGEKEQLQPVAHGNSFKLVTEQFDHVTTKVHDIVRQKSKWDRQFVEMMASGQAREAMKELYDRKRVLIGKDAQDSLNQLVDRWMNQTHNETRKITYTDARGRQKTREANVVTTTPAHEKLITADRNDDVSTINAAIRSELQKRGKLAQDEVTVMCRPHSGKKEETGFSRGDRVMFTRATKTDDVRQIQVENSERGEIVGLSYDKSTGKPKAMQIRLDSHTESEPRTVWINLEKNKTLNIRHAYAMTTYKSQGQTVRASYMFGDQSNLHKAYVAASRHKESLTVFINDGMKNKMMDRMEGKQPTEKMLQVAHWLANERGIKLEPEITESFIETRKFLNRNYSVFDERGMKPPHKMDEWSDLLEAMETTQYKRTTQDFQVIEGHMAKLHERFNERRLDMIMNPHLYTDMEHTKQKWVEGTLDVIDISDPIMAELQHIVDMTPEPVPEFIQADELYERQLAKRAQAFAEVEARVTVTEFDVPSAADAVAVKTKPVVKVDDGGTGTDGQEHNATEQVDDAGESPKQKFKFRLKKPKL